MKYCKSLSSHFGTRGTKLKYNALVALKTGSIGRGAKLKSESI